jgi:hypothetical protein
MIMKRFAVLLIISAVFALFSAACGPDETAPADPGSSAVIPDTVFFNVTGNDEVVLFSGKATDNRVVDSVDISFDNGASWHAAEITPDPTIRDVIWSYYATNADMPTTSTVLIRVADQDDNETISSPVTVGKSSSSTPASLRDVFSTATADDVIALSSGWGSAYGNSNIPIDVPVTILGAGYGDTATTGGMPLPAVASTATVLEAGISQACIFSVGADLTIKDIRFVGSATAIIVDDVDATVIVEDCLFDAQDAWAVRAVGDGNTVDIQFLSSGVDMSSGADSTSRGGLYLENVTYEVAYSGFYYMTDPLGPDDDTITGAAVQAVGGSGVITESLFEDNALAIWASGGSPLITSCEVSGATADTSYGINLTGEPGPAVIRRNTIDGNSGYGLRVGGEMELVLRRNAITNNALSGVFIDSSLPNGDLVNIDMGTVDDQGRNLLDDNTHPSGVSGYETQVWVTQDTNEGGTWIPANWNYWGYTTLSDINLSIIDNGDNGGLRATIAVGNFHISTDEVGP